MKTLRLCLVAVFAAGAIAATGCSSGGSNTGPSAPTGVVATGGNGEVTITWSAVPGATSYNVYWSTTAGVTTANGTKIGGVSSPYRQTGLTNGTTYYYVVTAVDASGESAPSSQVSAAASATSAAPYILASVFTQAGGGESPYYGGAQVFVCTDNTCSTSVSTATVTVNGVALVYSGNAQGYFDTGNLVIAEGATVTVEVTIGANSYTVSGTQFTTPPTVTSPTAGAIWTAANVNNITWTGGGPTAGAGYYAQMYDTSYNQVFPLPANTASGELPLTTTVVLVTAGSLPTGTLYVQVGIISPGAITQASGGISIPNAAAGSALWFALLAPVVSVTSQ